MSEAKFTPGKWVVDCCSEVVDAVGCMIADVFGVPDGEREANCNLIAVAPELYEIVAYVVKEHSWCSWPTNVGEPCGDSTCEDGCQVLRLHDG